MPITLTLIGLECEYSNTYSLADKYQSLSLEIPVPQPLKKINPFLHLGFGLEYKTNDSISFT